MVKREVRRHAQQPGLRASVETDAFKLPPGAQKCLLAEIVRRLLLARHAPEISEDGAVARREKRLEALTLASERIREWIGRAGGKEIGRASCRGRGWGW